MRVPALAMALLTLLLALAAACGGGEEPSPQATATPAARTPAPTQAAPATPTPRPVAPTATPAATPTATPAASPTAIAVKVFFSKRPDSENDPSKVFAVERVSPTLGVAKFAVQQLVAGPSAAEQAQGLFSEWTKLTLSGSSNCAGEDFTIAIQNQVATIKFCRQVQLLGVLSDARADSALKATLGQFPNVGKVVILDRNDRCLFDASGQDRCK